MTMMGPSIWLEVVQLDNCASFIFFSQGCHKMAGFTRVARVRKSKLEMKVAAPHSIFSHFFVENVTPI